MTAADGHRDAAAYALGVLEPLDALRCADHLTACPGCAREHEEFVRVATALAELVPPPTRTDTVMTGPGTGRAGVEAGRGTGHAGAEAVRGTGSAELGRAGAGRGKGRAGAGQAGDGPDADRAADRRRRWKARLVAWPSVAAVLLAAVLLPDDPPAAVRFSATDRSTGVTASATLEDREWGAAVGLRMAGPRGGPVCELFAVDRQGRELPLLTWRANEAEAPLIETAAPVHPSEIDHLTVRTPDGVRLADLRRN